MNLIFGRFKLNPIQLAREYIPSVVGLPTKMLTKDLPDTHTKITAYRAIRKISISRSPNTVHRYMIKWFNTIIVFQKTTNKWVDLQWFMAKFIGANRHFMDCRLSQQGALMCIAYEQERLVSSNELAKKHIRKLYSECYLWKKERLIHAPNFAPNVLLCKIIKPTCSCRCL